MKRNQIIIGALTVLLGVAGYINFSGNKLDLAPGELEPTESAFAEEQNGGQMRNQRRLCPAS